MTEDKTEIIEENKEHNGDYDLDEFEGLYDEKDEPGRDFNKVKEVVQ